MHVFGSFSISMFFNVFHSECVSDFLDSKQMDYDMARLQGIYKYFEVSYRNTSFKFFLAFIRVHTRSTSASDLTPLVWPSTQ